MEYFKEIWEEEEDNNGNDKEEGGEKDNDPHLAPSVFINRWYDYVKDFLDHVNDLLQAIVVELLDILSIDKMMKLFKGRHVQTVIMKNKLINKGFKFWACCCPTTTFAFCFVPSG